MKCRFTKLRVLSLVGVTVALIVVPGFLSAFVATTVLPVQYPTDALRYSESADVIWAMNRGWLATVVDAEWHAKPRAPKEPASTSDLQGFYFGRFWLDGSFTSEDDEMDFFATIRSQRAPSWCRFEMEAGSLQIEQRGPPLNVFQSRDVGVGFPFRSFAYTRVDNPYSGFKLDVIQLSPRYFLPTRILWLGLASNAVVFLAVPSCAFGLFSSLVAHYRRKRGKCMTCGHQLIDENTRCPECGVTVAP